MKQIMQLEPVAFSNIQHSQILLDLYSPIVSHLVFVSKHPVQLGYICLYTTVGCTVGSLLSSVVLSFAKLSPHKKTCRCSMLLCILHYSIERYTVVVAVVYLYCAKYSSLSVTKYQCCHLHKSCRLSSSFLYGEQYRLSDYARAKQELNTS